MTDFPDFQTEAAAAAAIGNTSLVGTGLAIDPTAGGTIATGAHVQALHTAGTTVGLEAAQSMLAAVAGVTTELASLIATGTAGGTPGGVPLLRGGGILSSSTVTVAAGASNTAISNLAFTAPSYAMRLVLTAAASGATLYGRVTLQWQEGGVTIAQKTFQVAASTGGHILTINGPVRGSTLNVTFTTPSSSGAAVTFAWQLAQEARLAANDLCRTITSLGSGPPTSATWAGLQMDAGILANGAPSVAAAGSSTRGLATYNGATRIQVHTSSGLADCTVVLQDLAALLAGGITPNYGNLYEDTTDSHGNLNNTITLPDFQCVLILTNTNAAAQTLSYLLTAGEPNVN